MTNIRILKHDDLDHYTQLLSSNTHLFVGQGLSRKHFKQ